MVCRNSLLLHHRTQVPRAGEASAGGAEEEVQKDEEAHLPGLLPPR